MGSGPSRGKKVAPACVSEVTVAKTAARVTATKHSGGPFRPLKIQTILRTARNRAQPDRHSEGNDSECSGEDDDIDGELDTVMANYEERERASVKKPPSKKTFIRSRTYGLCHFGREDTDEDFSSETRIRESGSTEPRGSHRGDVNKRGYDAFSHFKKHTPLCPNEHTSSSQSVLTRGSLLEAVATKDKQFCHNSSLTMPVILYDGSEEELMDTIEREFS
ncbi:uncharacterized protein LOC115414196 [Sphaeramia orbicularis]|uniref:uncharacterized protein LOC115414196 n=1 Tax=Sphaeramia orbicularis TaxID=375764 RepID=UPI00117F5606|nr:uncharacterized protein LOC115414196 [Sphaeramia orbicularis]